MAAHRIKCKECNGKGSITVVVCRVCKKPLDDNLAGGLVDDWERKLCSACWEKDDIETGKTNFERRPKSLAHILAKLRVLSVDKVKIWLGVASTMTGGPWNNRIKKATNLPAICMSIQYDGGTQIDKIVTEHRQTWPAGLWWIHPEGHAGVRNFQVYIFAEDVPEAYAECQKINTGNGSTDAHFNKLNDLEQQAGAYHEELLFQAKDEIDQLSMNIEKMREQRRNTIYQVARTAGLQLDVDDNGFKP